MQFTPYLYFRGACEDALKFYQSCGLGAIRLIRRYEGTPMAERDRGAWRDKVLHSVFEGPAVRLYASDGSDSEPMKGCALLIENDDPDAAGALFAALSDGGRVTVPFKKQFWATTTATSPTSSAFSGPSTAVRSNQPDIARYSFAPHCDGSASVFGGGDKRGVNL